jgi:hypothetical protein
MGRRRRSAEILRNDNAAMLCHLPLTVVRPMGGGFVAACSRGTLTAAEGDGRKVINPSGA